MLKEHLAAAYRPSALYTYEVRGIGPFPLDMLRYDCAWPVSSEDVQAMAERGVRSVKLSSYKPPTADRWASFMWRLK